jgi:hypothetical protein
LKRINESNAAVTLATAPAAIITITTVAEITVAAITKFALAAEFAFAPAVAPEIAVATVAVATGTTSATTTASAAALVSAAAATSAAVASATGRTTATTAAAAGRIPALFGFAHAQVPAAEIGAIQLGHRRLAEFTARKGDEGKPTGSAGFTVDRHVQINDGFEGSEELAQFGFRSVVRQVSNIQFHRFSTSCRSRRFQAALPLSGKNA